jgi:hypothetical protein
MYTAKINYELIGNTARNRSLESTETATNLKPKTLTAPKKATPKNDSSKQ